MTSRYSISVGGKKLESMYTKSLLILDIQHSQPDLTFQTQTNANLDGVDVLDTYVGQRTVTVTFELRIYDIAARNAACQVINEWASKGGTLITNDRAGQQLMRVICTQYADIESAKNWTDPLTLVFSTTDCPYWVSQTAKSRTIAGPSGSSKLTLDGNVGSALVSVVATAQAKLTAITFKVDGRKLVLKGLNVPKGKTVEVSYLKGRYLYIKANGSKAISKLDPSSNDNLLMVCGKKDSPVSFSTDGKASVTFTARGMHL